MESDFNPLASIELCTGYNVVEVVQASLPSAMAV